MLMCRFKNELDTQTAHVSCGICLLSWCLGCNPQSHSFYNNSELFNTLQTLPGSEITLSPPSLHSISHSLTHTHTLNSRQTLQRTLIIHLHEGLQQLIRVRSTGAGSVISSIGLFTCNDLIITLPVIMCVLFTRIVEKVAGL